MGGIFHSSSDNVGSMESKSCGGLSALVTMLDQEGGQNAEVGEGRGITHDEGGGTGSTPGTGTAPLSGHSSSHSSGNSHLYRSKLSWQKHLQDRSSNDFGATSKNHLGNDRKILTLKLLYAS